MTNPNNEPAFPYAFEHQDASGFNPGMSLRDYFAGQALAGLLADPNVTDPAGTKLAEACYRHADAMLEARKK